MKKNIIIVLLLLIICSACKTTKSNYEFCSYENRFGYKDLYLVDTIQIDDPVCITSSEGYNFIMSRESYHAFDASDLTIEDLLHADYAFLDGGIMFNWPSHFVNLLQPKQFCSRSEERRVGKEC